LFIKKPVLFKKLSTNTVDNLFVSITSCVSKVYNIIKLKITKNFVFFVLNKHKENTDKIKKRPKVKK